jgi:hypothetical protein
MRTKALFATLFGIDFVLLLLQIQGLSIGYHEAQIVYGESSPLQLLLNLSFSLFGQSDYALRIPMIVLHLFSVALLYGISSYYVTRDTDRLWVVLVYVLLPGVISSALVVDNAGLMIASLFLFAYLYLRYGMYALGMLPFLLWIDPAFAYLFFAIALYGMYRKEYIWAAAGTVSLFTSLYFFGIQVGGLPESRFLDLLGVYAAIFSPIVFVYLFYVLYRRMIAREWDMIWTIAASAFTISLLLSFRQKVPVQTFAPFLLLALPLAAQTFFKTYRIRLRVFRRRYRLLFYSAFVVLIFNALAVFFNQWMYRFVSDPSRHFSYPMHVAKELSQTLKEHDIRCIDAGDEKLQLRLRFYGITHCSSCRLEVIPNPKGKKVTISYKKNPVFIGYVTKINNY